MNRHRFLWLAFLLMACVQASANRGGFYYRNISIEAVVHENNVWDVTETFDIFFEEPRHGFYRFIPQSFDLTHKVADEGSSKKKKVKFTYECDIDDIDVEGWDFTTEQRDNEFLVIRIGDSDREVEGNQRYVISYTYTYPDDRLTEYDYLFHTVLGTEFEQPIEHVEFSIEFDKPLPQNIADRLKVYAGEYGKTDGMVPSLRVEADRTKIQGEADSIAPRQGITLYARLPADYYEGAKTVNYIFFYLFLTITIALILLLVWLHFRQNTPHVTKVIEFYPPEGISSAEVGTIIDTSADTIDIASLIPWMASKGYLSIREVKKGKLFKYTDLELTKLQDPPEKAPAYQKRLMDLLFSGGDVVCMKDLGRKPDEFQRVKSALSDYFKGNRKLTSIRWPLWLYIVLGIFGTLALGTDSVVATFYPLNLIGAAVFFGIPFFLAAFYRVDASKKDLLRSSTRRVLFFIIKAILMLATWAGFCYVILDYGAPLGAVGVLVIYVACFILNELAGRFIINTDYRVQMMGRLLGFKEFIQTAEKPRLEQLQADDPQYFYKVLPYAMVFGLSDKWGDMFKDIEMEQPDWYHSATPLTGHALTHHMTHSLYASTSSAISTISHSNSSSGGGGGFSGGGGGGGGGGSW